MCHITVKRKNETAFGICANYKTLTTSDCKAAQAWPTQAPVLNLCSRKLGQSMAGPHITPPPFTLYDDDRFMRSRLCARVHQSPPLLSRLHQPTFFCSCQFHPPPCSCHSFGPRGRERGARHRDRAVVGARGGPSPVRSHRQAFSSHRDGSLAPNAWPRVDSRRA